VTVVLLDSLDVTVLLDVSLVAAPSLGLERVDEGLDGEVQPALGLDVMGDGDVR